MPRGVQKSDKERLEIIEKDIAEMEERKSKIQSKISELNNQKKEIVAKIEQKKLLELAQIIENSGKTPDDVLAMLNQK